MDREAFRDWLGQRPREWSIVIAARAALRVLPLVSGHKNLSAILLPIFRATAIARFAGKYSNRPLVTRAAQAVAARNAGSSGLVVADFARGAAHAQVDADDEVSANAAAFAAAFAAASVTDGSNATAGSAAIFAATAATPFVAASTVAVTAAIRHDAQQLISRQITPERLAASVLWPPAIGGIFAEFWQDLKHQLQTLDAQWWVWIDWYEGFALNEPLSGRSEAEEAAYTDVAGKLPWNDGAEAVNTEIARRLAALTNNAPDPKIPEQSPAPVRVEERYGRISKASDRDSPLAASERDFRDWRDPLVDHIDELSAADFALGTNHGRVRDRLLALGKLLPGDISDVKDRQFRIGYEVERFEGLMVAYRSGGDDMPALNAAQLEDLDRLRVALKMGIDKLERWSEFRQQSSQSTAHESDADAGIVGDALDEMAVEMDRRSQFFDPELPATFRFLAEAARDRMGATKTIVYGAVKSAENLIAFLGQKSLGIGKKGVDAVESNISKAVAASLVAGLSTAALKLSGALPQGWGWLKPLLAALSGGG